MAKVAIASTDGINIDEHFGRADSFFIYEKDEEGRYQPVEKREIPKDLPDYDPHGSIDTLAQILKDVEAVLVAQIGPKMAAALERKGILALGISGPIDTVLKSYAKKSRLIKNIAASYVLDCGTGESGGCSCSRGCGK